MPFLFLVTTHFNFEQCHSYERTKHIYEAMGSYRLNENVILAIQECCFVVLMKTFNVLSSTGVYLPSVTTIGSILTTTTATTTATATTIASMSTTTITCSVAAAVSRKCAGEALAESDVFTETGATTGTAVLKGGEVQ